MFWHKRLLLEIKALNAREKTSVEQLHNGGF